MRRIALLPLACATLALMGPMAAPAVSQEVPEIEFEKYELANGLDVILYEDHTLPMVTVNVWYHVGSGMEQPGRTGFAHLFEHMMFQGSENHRGEYFEPLQKIGGAINGSTNPDRTNYWQNVPSNYLELVLWLEADRMGFLLPAMDQEKLDNQRDVVKNERRQRLENQPYGKVREMFPPMLYPEGHPYSWTTIGSMEDLSAASMEDLTTFFKAYYNPNNTSIVIAGDIDVAQAKELVEKYFGSIPPGPAVDRYASWTPQLTKPVRAVAEDNVELQRLYYRWNSPAFLKPGDAEFDLLASILATGKTSRLYKALVYEQEIAQDVNAGQFSRELGSEFGIRVTAREGHTLYELEAALDAELEKLLTEGITEAELAEARIAWETSFVRRLEQVGGFGGIANQLNTYNTYLGDPGMFAYDFGRYSNATVESVNMFARRYMSPDSRATVSVVPRGDLQMVASDFDRSMMPGGGPEPAFTPPNIQRAQLDNGLRVLVVEDHSVPLVQTNLVIRSGWASDPADRPGAASITAAMLDEGTKSMNALQISAETKRIAARLNTGSFFDGSNVNLNVLRRNLDDGLALMADIVLNPTFPDEELERQRQIYLGRIAQEAKQPTTAAIKTFLRTLYGADHAYGQPFTGSGTEASITAITRKDLEDYYQANYKPNNAALIFVGDLTLAEAQQQAQRAFGDWRRGDVAAADIPDPTPVTRTQLYIVDKPGAAQSVILAGNVGLKRNAADYRAFEIMNNAFGGKFSSRINLNLREDKGYSYGARSIFLGTRATGPFFVLAPVQTQSTKESVVEIINEYRAIVGERPITEQEADEAKGNMIKGFPQQFQTVGNIAGQVANMIMYDLPDDEWLRYINDLESITPQQATKAARDHLNPDALLIVIVGDREKIEPGLQELGLGEVKYLAADLE